MTSIDLIVVLVVCICIMGIVLNVLSNQNDCLREESKKLQKRLGGTPSRDRKEETMPEKYYEPYGQGGFWHRSSQKKRWKMQRRLGKGRGR